MSQRGDCEGEGHRGKGEGTQGWSVWGELEQEPGGGTLSLDKEPGEGDWYSVSGDRKWENEGHWRLRWGDERDWPRSPEATGTGWVKRLGMDTRAGGRLGQ